MTNGELCLEDDRGYLITRDERNFTLADIENWQRENEGRFLTSRMANVFTSLIYGQIIYLRIIHYLQIIHLRSRAKNVRR